MKKRHLRKNYKGVLLTINDGVMGLVRIRLLSGTNGLIRQYFPKGTDFATITPEQVQWVQDKLNARPRKRLGYMSPKEKFKQLTNLDYSAVALSA